MLVRNKFKWFEAMSMAMALVVGSTAAQAAPLGTAVTYQGQLKSGGDAANGSFNLVFTLWDSAGAGNPPVGGSQIGGADNEPATAIVDGLFTVQLNDTNQFGPTAFTGDARWVQISVNGTTLGPRQPITAAPFAHALRLPYSGSFDGSDQTALSILQSGLGYAANFASDDAGNYYGTVGVSCAGTGPSLFVTHSAAGSCARFQNVTQANGVPTVHATTNGGGAALYGDASLGTNGIGVIGIGRGSGDGLRGSVDGSGVAVKGTTSGTGRAAHFQSTNAGNNLSTLRVDTNSTNAGVAAVAGVNSGAGRAGHFEISNAANSREAILALTNGSGAGLRVQNGSDYLDIHQNSINTEGDGFLGDPLYLNNTSLSSVLIGFGGGNCGIGGGTAGLPVAPLHVDGGTDASATDIASGYFVVGASNAHNIVMDNNEIMARNNDAAATLFLNHNGGAVHIGQGSGGTTRIVVPVVQITGGSDLSENFDVSNPDGARAEPGMVLCIDTKNPGRLTPCGRAYDKTVAGVISGAGGVKPGMLMGQAGSIADGSHPVALTGRVYVKCDASESAIEPGDMLTTSASVGHAMKVHDHLRAQGAIIGKAMTALEQGKTGLVLVLVNLQ